MKRLAITTLLTIFASLAFAQTAQVTSFSELMEALKKGVTVKVIFDYEKCQLISDNEVADKSVQAIGGMRLDTWEFFAAGAVKNKEAFIAFSETKTIYHPTRKVYVYNYVKVRVDEKNRVKITAEYIDPKTWEVTMTENFFTEISDGKNGKGASFFIEK